MDDWDNLLALLPQIILNYQNGSAENQSIYFWILWLVGDVMNLSGCILADEIITNTGLAAVYLFFTFICFIQYIWYNVFRADQETRYTAIYSTPLGPTSTGAKKLPIPGSHAVGRSPTLSPLPRARGFSSPNLNLRKRSRPQNYGSTLIPAATAISVSLTAFACFRSEIVVEPMRRRLGGTTAAVSGIVLGWMMCLVYTVSRVPQIRLMMKDRNVEGIAPLFFFLTFSGNLTQFLAMTVKEQVSFSYINTNLPWLLSAFLCAFEDMFVLYLFWKITREEKAKKKDMIACGNSEMQILIAG